MNFKCLICSSCLTNEVHDLVFRLSSSDTLRQYFQVFPPMLRIICLESGSYPDMESFKARVKSTVSLSLIQAKLLQAFSYIPQFKFDIDILNYYPNECITLKLQIRDEVVQNILETLRQECTAYAPNLFRGEVRFEIVLAKATQKATDNFVLSIVEELTRIRADTIDKCPFVSFAAPDIYFSQNDKHYERRDEGLVF